MQKALILSQSNCHFSYEKIKMGKIYIYILRKLNTSSVCGVFSTLSVPMFSSPVLT